MDATKLGQAKWADGKFMTARFDGSIPAIAFLDE
jgi:hypothetical protein